MLALTLGVNFPISAFDVFSYLGPHIESEMAGYNIHYGTKSGKYEVRLEFDTGDSMTVENLQRTMTHLFVPTASEVSVNEIDWSNKTGSVILAFADTTPPKVPTHVRLAIGTSSNEGHDCFDTAGAIETVKGHFEEKFSPATAPGKAFDARQADFLNYQVKWGMITVAGSRSDTDMCWVGGYVTSNKPWDASWADHKDLDGPTRNSAAISNASTDMTVTGIHYFNVHDGVRTSDAINWVVEHTWGEYIRDDAIENDHLHSGRIYDCLFDGCYTGISTRPSSSDGSSDGAGELIKLDKVLMRLQAMPYPYKWETKSGVIDADGNPYDGTGTPFGHGAFFKLTDTDQNPHFSIKNSVFLAVHLTRASDFDFPPESLIDECQNNTIIWLGPGPYPGKLPSQKFPSSFKIVTGQEGRDLWRNKVIDWHARHPDVDPDRKPSAPGSLVFPRTF